MRAIYTEEGVLHQKLLVPLCVSVFIFDTVICKQSQKYFAHYAW